MRGGRLVAMIVVPGSLASKIALAIVRLGTLARSGRHSPVDCPALAQLDFATIIFHRQNDAAGRRVMGGINGNIGNISIKA